MPSAAELLREAGAAGLRGWDFGWIADRVRTVEPPWDFGAMSEALLGDGQVRVGLDMETGGGERLARLRWWAPLMVATEAWLPNVPVAAERLAPCGVRVVLDEGAVDNVEQADGRSTGRLPFRTGAFDVVINRHGAFVAAEVARVLRPGGTFLTQQEDSASARFHHLLGLEPPTAPVFDLDLATAQVTAAGLVVEETDRGQVLSTFADIGALAWYLRMVPWCVPGFTIGAHEAALAQLHGSEIRVASDRFWLRARTQEDAS
ncbi:class I SAM-dependent methyltransferase [soil metagenome]